MLFVYLAFSFVQHTSSVTKSKKVWEYDEGKKIDIIF